MTSMRFQGGKDMKHPTRLTTSRGKKIESLKSGWMVEDAGILQLQLFDAKDFEGSQKEV